MRKGIISIILVAVLTTAALISGCTPTGLANVVTEETEFTDFTHVDVEGTFEVEIIQSDLFSITITADKNFFDYIAVAKEGENLRIYLNPRHTFTDFTLRAKTLTAKITMPVLHGVSLSGASKGTVSGFKSSQDFSLNVSGASSMDLDDIEVGNVKFEISGASKVTGSMTASDIKLEVSGASKVELAGSANNIMLSASGASEVNLADVPLNDAYIKLSGASKATLTVKGRLDTILTAASSLYFSGNPTVGDIRVSGASTIKHE